ncbi:MAG: hypothetical protein ISS84_00915 [Candidatus Pacebacteria bacterium]|nr:hypothetical protein [Candidatus Paceibacterota bacterium]
MAKSLPKDWWLTGGWAIEVITGVSSSHRDIDIHAKEGIPAKGRFLDIHIIHEENSFFVERASHGTFWFSKEAFENEQRSLYGIPVRIVTPELLYLLAKGSPNPRAREKEILQLLQDFVSPEKMKKILQYQPLIAPP